MTERDNSLPRKPDQQPLPEGFEMPSESVLKAEANRNYNEIKFVYDMNRTAEMPDELMSPADKRAYQQARMAKVKQMLTLDTIDPQRAIDEIDMKQWAKDTNVETSVLGVVVETVPIEEYQLENYVRSSANIIRDKVKPETTNNIRKGFIKHFKEAKIMSEERQIPQEDVFNDQQLYFELMRRSTSPEEIILQTKEFIKLLKASLIPLVENEHRTGSLVANADNENITVDEIDKDASKFISNPKIKTLAEREMEEYEEFLLKGAFTTIDRYWGPKIAALFN